MGQEKNVYNVADWGVIDFTQSGFFHDQTEEGIGRRKALLAAAQGVSLISLYEARTIPLEEMLSFAYEQEKKYWEENKRTGWCPVGKTADGYGIVRDDVVFDIPNPIAFDEKLEEGCIIEMSTFCYIAKVRSETSEFTIPTRMLFKSKSAAEYARMEFLAYSVAPDVRR
jgi:hypothetical protein